MSFPSHKCPGCGFAKFEEEPCAVCLNPHLFLERPIEAPQEPEFHAVMTAYRQAIPYRYVGALSECIDLQRRKAESADRRALALEMVLHEAAEFVGHDLLTKFETALLSR